jgi:SPP1 gp7 family putative phage head morphogenesis protein
MKPVSRSYFRDLNRLVRALFRDIDKQILTKLPRWTKEEAALNSSDTMDDELSFLIEQLKQQYSSPQVLFEYQDAARKAARNTTVQSGVRTRKQLKDLGIDIFKETPQLARLSQRFVRRNTALIVTIPQQSLNNVEQVIEAGVQAGMRSRDLAKQITGIVSTGGEGSSELRKARNRAAVIARDQTLTHSAQLSRSRQRANGIDSFIWRTVGDGRVRDLHEDRDGVEYTWKDGAGGTDTYPGDGVQCRCSAEPVL